MIRFLFLLVSALSLYAATPKIYSTIGDPVYAAVGPTRQLSTFKTFKEDRALFSSFADQADTAKEEGFWLDKYRLLPEAKKRSQLYLKTLRHLQRINAQISKIVKDTTMAAIKKHHAKTYAAIKKTHHPVFHDDAELRRAATRFEQQLKREYRNAQKKKQRRYKAYLRSSKNLNGTWKGKTAEGKVHFRFKGNALSITKISPKLTQRLQGKWQIKGNTLTIDLHSITNTRSDGIPHTRKSHVTLTMQIQKISKKSLLLFDTRRKETIHLLR